MSADQVEQISHGEFVRLHNAKIAAHHATHRAELDRAAEIRSNAERAKAAAVEAATAKHEAATHERLVAWQRRAAATLDPVVAAFDGTRATAVAVRNAWQTISHDAGHMCGQADHMQLGHSFAAALVARRPDALRRLANPIAYHGDLFDKGIGACVHRAKEALILEDNPSGWLDALIALERAVAVWASTGQSIGDGNPTATFDILRFGGADNETKIAAMQAALRTPPDLAEVQKRFELAQQYGAEHAPRKIRAYLTAKAQGVVDAVTEAVAEVATGVLKPAKTPRTYRERPEAVEAVEHPGDLPAASAQPVGP